MPAGLSERESELARVDALLAAAREGRGGMLLITGPAGIGKTVLLAAARERAGRAGMRVLAGRGGELESGFPSGWRVSCSSRCSARSRSGGRCWPGWRGGP